MARNLVTGEGVYRGGLTYGVFLSPVEPTLRKEDPFCEGDRMMNEINDKMLPLIETSTESDERIRELGDDPVYYDYEQIPSRMILPHIQLHGRTGWWAQNQLTGSWCWAGSMPPDITLAFALDVALKELREWQWLVERVRSGSI